MAFVVQFDLESGERYHRVFVELRDAMAYFNRVREMCWHGSEASVSRGETGIVADYALFQASVSDARQAVQQVKDGAARLIDDLESDGRRARANAPDDLPDL